MDATGATRDVDAAVRCVCVGGRAARARVKSYPIDKTPTTKKRLLSPREDSDHQEKTPTAKR